MLASFPASMLNQNTPDLGILNRLKLDPSRSSMPGTMAGYLIAGTGAVAILTGFFGFCPMCAMVGRRLPSP